MLGIQTPEDNEYLRVTPKLKFKWSRLVYSLHMELPSEAQELLLTVLAEE